MTHFYQFRYKHNKKISDDMEVDEECEKPAVCGSFVTAKQQLVRAKLLCLFFFLIQKMYWWNYAYFSFD